MRKIQTQKSKEEEKQPNMLRLIGGMILRISTRGGISEWTKKSLILLKQSIQASEVSEASSNDAERDLVTTIVITGQIPQGIGNINVLSPCRQAESTKTEVLTEGSAGKDFSDNDILGPTAWDRKKLAKR